MRAVKRKPPRRDAALSRRAILDAALVEFADLGHAGARIDAIAERAGVSKPMIYSYFGDKDGLWAAALREAYVQIRAGERELDLGGKEPEAAIRALVAFTQAHFVEKPWFISMLNTENLLGGGTVREIADVAEIQSPLIVELGARAAARCGTGAFRGELIRSTSTSPSRRSAISRWRTCTRCARSSGSPSTRSGSRRGAPSWRR